MQKNTNPTDVARETLKQLAVRRIAPTPDHYESIYHEIARTPDEERLHPGIKQLVASLRGLPKQTPELQRQTHELSKLATAESWQELVQLYGRIIEAQGGQIDLSRTWSDLIRDLIRQWDLRTSNLPKSHKKTALETVLINFASDPTQLNEKLSSLIKSWEGGSGGDRGIETAGIENSESYDLDLTSNLTDPGLVTNWQDWREALYQALHLGTAARLMHSPDLQQEAEDIARAINATESATALQEVIPRLRKFWIRLELQNDQEIRLCDGLMNLLRLLTNNIAEIVIEDDWVRGQIAVVQQIMAQPLDMRVIYDAEAGLKEVLFKQGQLKHSLQEAQITLKSMLVTFIDRLSVMAESTDQYHNKISDYSTKIQDASDLTSIQHILEDLMQDTRSMQLDVARSRDELLEAKHEADAAQKRVVELEIELESVSTKIREDQLTGALNRRGMEETFDIELSRAQRSNRPFSLALLDLDNFKKLNDTRGHAAGDAALVHLVQVVKDLLRPTDSVARYGGEEFILMLPDTPITEAAKVVKRLQRDLTKRFFLHNNEKVLITFSAGVTLVSPEEDRIRALERADAAMYRAKKLGKNRVEILVPKQE